VLRRDLKAFKTGLVLKRRRIGKNYTQMQSNVGWHNPGKILNLIECKENEGNSRTFSGINDPFIIV
jgi:hypothetical protein